MGRELTNVETETVRHRETKKKQLQSRYRERGDDIQAIILDFRSGFSMFFQYYLIFSWKIRLFSTHLTLSHVILPIQNVLFLVIFPFFAFDASSL